MWKFPDHTVSVLCNQKSVQADGVRALLPRPRAGLFPFGGQFVAPCSRASEGARAASGLDVEAVGSFWGDPGQEHHLELNVKLCVFFLIIRRIRTHCS